MRCLRLLLLIWAVPVFAQDTVPEASPRPVERPAQENAEAPEPEADIDLPSEVPAVGQRDLLELDDTAYEACLIRLTAAGVAYEAATPIVPDTDRDCGILRPLKVSAIGSVAIEPPAILRCPTAEALATWTADFVLPASARLAERGALATIENGSGYICRRRNGSPDGKLSEHAFGNAFDVMGFGFADGTRIAIEPREAEGSMEEAFQDAVRASACLEFSTVLGPGSNEFHDDHLHLDIVARSSGYRLCEQGGGASD